MMKFQAKLTKSLRNFIIGVMLCITLSVTAVAGTFSGVASWYGPGFHGKHTASGERYDMYAMTAAHKTLPFGTIVKVTNLKNNKSVKLKINDRGPYKKGRVIDISKKANQIIDCHLCKVKVEVVKRGNQKYKRHP